MDEVSLFNFFENRVTIKQGMLQGFVDPKGDHNCIASYFFSI